MKHTNLVAALVVAVASSCGGPQFHAIESATPSITVQRIDLTWSNVYLIAHGDSAILVDSGSPPDKDALAAALDAAHVQPRAVVLTHGHADHAGLARWLQSRGVKVILGAGDVPVASRGMNDPLPATGLLGGWLAPLFMFPYEPFTPDVVVDHAIDLGAFGFPDVHVEPAPGHTPGALVVVAATDAFAGDLLKGGAFAKIAVETPTEHYYQADPIAAHKAIAALLDRGVTRIYLGHGGPIAASDARDYLRDADTPERSRFGLLQLGAEGGTSNGPKELAGLVRVRYGIGGTIGYYGGLDVRSGGFGGGFFRIDAYEAGVMVRCGGTTIGLAGGFGYGGLAIHTETHAGAELFVDTPLVGPLHGFARANAQARTSGDDDDAPKVTGFITGIDWDAGIRLGRDRQWGRVLAGGGLYLNVFQTYTGITTLTGIGIGWQMSAGD